MGDRYGRLRRPVVVLSGTREEILDLENCVANALDGGERGTGGAHVEFEGVYVAVTVKERDE